MYPLLMEGVQVGTFEDEETGETGYFVENADGESFELGEDVYRLLMLADGRHDFYAQGLPAEDTADILRQLKECRLVFTRRLRLGFPFGRLVLWLVGDRAARLRRPCILLNRLLPYACLLLCLAGAFCLRTAFNPDFLKIPLLLTLLLVVGSLFLHEMGHFCAAVAYGCPVTDMGILLLGILPVGAYISQTQESPRRSQRLQNSLAGLEVNFALAGLCALLSPLPGQTGLVFSAACIWNLLLGGSNLLPAAGLDGEEALSILLGLPSFGEFALNALRTPESRRMMLRGGVRGWFWLAVCLLQLLCRLMVVLMFAVGVAIGQYLG